jgi:hypothetical protein
MRGRDHGFPSRLEIRPGKLETAAALTDTAFRSLSCEQPKVVAGAVCEQARPSEMRALPTPAERT